MANKPINSVDLKVPPINFNSKLLGSDEEGITYNFKLSDMLVQAGNDEDVVYVSGDETTEGSFRFINDGNVKAQELINGTWGDVVSFSSMYTDVLGLDSTLDNKDTYLAYKANDGTINKILTPVANGLAVGNSDSVMRLVSAGAIEIDYNINPSEEFIPYGDDSEDVALTGPLEYFIIQDEESTIYSAKLKLKNVPADTAVRIIYEERSLVDNSVINAFHGTSCTWKTFINVDNPLATGDNEVTIDYLAPITLNKGHKYRVQIEFTNDVTIQGQTIEQDPSIGSAFYPYVVLDRKVPIVGEVAYWDAWQDGNEYFVDDKVFVSARQYDAHGVYRCIQNGVQSGTFEDNIQFWVDATDEPRMHSELVISEGYGSVAWTNSVGDSVAPFYSYNMAKRWLDGTALGDSRAKLTLTAEDDFIGKMFHDAEEIVQFGATTHATPTDIAVQVGEEQPEIEGFWSIDVPIDNHDYTDKEGFHFYNLGLYDTTTDQVNGCMYIYDVSEPVAGEVGTGAGISYDYLTMSKDDFAPSVLRARCIDNNRVYSALEPKYHRAGHGYSTPAGTFEAGLVNGVYPTSIEHEAQFEKKSLSMVRIITEDKWILNGDGTDIEFNGNIKQFDIKELLTKAEAIANVIVEDGEYLIPAMITDTTPSGVASAPNGLLDGTEAYMAFNTPYKAPSLGKGVTLDNVAGESIIQYEFPELTTINGYVYSCGLDFLEFPNQRNFEGSNDGIVWDLIEYTAGVLLTNERVFNTVTEQQYKYYRMRFTGVTNPVELKIFNVINTQDVDVLNIDHTGFFTYGDIQADRVFAEDVCTTSGARLGDDKLLNATTRAYEDVIVDTEYVSPHQQGAFYGEVVRVYFQGGVLPTFLTTAGYVLRVVDGVIQFEDGGYQYTDKLYHYDGPASYYYIRVDVATNTLSLDTAGYTQSTFDGYIDYIKN